MPCGIEMAHRFTCKGEDAYSHSSPHLESTLCHFFVLSVLELSGFLSLTPILAKSLSFRDPSGVRDPIEACKSGLILCLWSIKGLVYSSFFCLAFTLV